MPKVQAKESLPEPVVGVRRLPDKSGYLCTPVGGETLTLPGVTGRLDWIGGDKTNAMKWWASNGASHYFHDAALAENFVGNEDRARIVYEEARRWHSRESARTAAFGTHVHLYAELTMKGQRPNMTRDFPKETHDCIRAFKAWWKWRSYEVLSAELAVANIEAGYAGTFDFLARDPKTGMLVLGDFKTAKAIRLSNAVQLAALNEALFKTYGIRADALHVVRIGREDAEVEERAVADEARSLSIFRAAMDIEAGLKEDLFQ